MAPKKRSKAKQPSPSPSASSSSEASSSRSTLEVEDAVAADRSDHDRASTSGSDTDDDDVGGAIAQDDDDSEEDSDDDHQRPTIDLAKARTKLHHVAKTLRATAKKSKTFEVQKLVKKLKGLRKKDTRADQAELAEKELTALKSIDTGLLAGRALITKMVKAKVLPRPTELEDAEEDDYPYLPMVKGEDLLGEEVLHDPVMVGGDRALERAKAKITSSKVLADEIGRFVDELKKLAGIEPAITKSKDELVDIKGKGKAKQEVDDDEDDEEDREWSGSDDNFESDEDEPRRLPVVDDDDDEEDADEEELARIGREKVKALGDLSQWDDMIGSDSAPESGSEDEAPAKLKRKRETDSEASSDDDDSTDENDSDTSDFDSDSDSDSESHSSPPSKRTKKKSKSTSTFLPSLSTGFVPGRSDDEWSDAEADLADRDLSDLTGAKKERKNRMGQRARKALYEKKYGKNANHIKMKEKRKTEKLERTTSRTSGVGGVRQRPPAFQAPKKTDGGWGGKVAPLPKQPKVTRMPRPAPVEVPKKEEAKAKSQEMHPSWIAKQKQKELMAQVKPQGKKVVFD